MQILTEEHSDFIIVSIAGLLQLGVACYAMKLTRLFGVQQVGWSLFSAFLLLALAHLIESVKTFSTGSSMGKEIEIIYAFISFLLLLALAHLETMLKDRQALERQAHKMESLGHLAEGVAHDFNNILTVIQAHSSLLLLEPKDSETTESLKEISEATKRAANLTQQLLLFGKQQSVLTENVNLNLLVYNISQMLRRLIGENIHLKTAHALSLPPIVANVGMIEQVVINLAINARDAMPGGGSLTIGTAAVKVDEAHVARQSQARTGDFVCIRVCDTGSGMAPDVLAKIFEPFFTTKNPDKGSGIGLATVHRIVQQHSGWIEVSSQVGVGTEFTVYFPRATDQVGEPAKPTAVSPISVGIETILMVEDEEAVRRLAAGFLRRKGYQVFEAGSGIKALEIWQENSAQIDVLLTDIVMPDGISGQDLANSLLELKHDLKVVYTSGYSFDRVGKSIKLVPGFQFVPKPYAPDDLLRAIHACLTVGN